MLDREQLEAVLSALGELLQSRNEHVEVVVGGGGNLILRDLISRPSTKDLDVIGAMTPRGIERMGSVPAPLARAISDVALTYGLANDWMNLGPEHLVDLGLPPGFEARLDRLDYGGLVVWTTSRQDMISLKLYAAADQGARSRHMQDLAELGPTSAELVAAAKWARSQDPSEGFKSLLSTAVRFIRNDVTDADLD